MGCSHSQAVAGPGDVRSTSSLLHRFGLRVPSGVKCSTHRRNVVFICSPCLDAHCNAHVDDEVQPDEFVEGLCCSRCSSGHAAHAQLVPVARAVSEARATLDSFASLDVTAKALSKASSFPAADLSALALCLAHVREKAAAIKNEAVSTAVMSPGFVRTLASINDADALLAEAIDAAETRRRAVILGLCDERSNAASRASALADAARCVRDEVHAPVDIVVCTAMISAHVKALRTEVHLRRLLPDSEEAEAGGPQQDPLRLETFSTPLNSDRASLDDVVVEPAHEIASTVQVPALPLPGGKSQQGDGVGEADRSIAPLQLARLVEADAVPAADVCLVLPPKMPTVRPGAQVSFNATCSAAAVVQAGSTLAAVARMLGVSVTATATLNAPLALVPSSPRLSPRDVSRPEPAALPVHVTSSPQADGSCSLELTVAVPSSAPEGSTLTLVMTVGGVVKDSGGSAQARVSRGLHAPLSLPGCGATPPHLVTPFVSRSGLIFVPVQGSGADPRAPIVHIYDATGSAVLTVDRATALGGSAAAAAFSKATARAVCYDDASGILLIALASAPHAVAAVRLSVPPSKGAPSSPRAPSPRSGQTPRGGSNECRLVWTFDRGGADAGGVAVVASAAHPDVRVVVVAQARPCRLCVLELDDGALLSTTQGRYLAAPLAVVACGPARVFVSSLWGSGEGDVGKGRGEKAEAEDTGEGLVERFVLDDSSASLRRDLELTAAGKVERGLRVLAAFPPGSAVGGAAGAVVIGTYVPERLRSGFDTSRSAAAWRAPRLIVADAATGALLRAEGPGAAAGAAAAQGPPSWGPDVVGLAADPSGAALVVVEAGSAGARVVHWAPEAAGGLVSPRVGSPISPRP